MRNKKGSHVDVVLSFVIFIMFVLFIFILVRPAGNFNKSHEQTFGYLKLEIEERVSGEILTVNLINSSTKNGEACVSMDVSDLNISGLTSIAKNFNGNTLNTEGSDTLEIEWPDSSGEFRIIYSASAFNTHTDTLENCLAGTIKSTRESEEIFESKILNLISDYESDYDGLKENFKISNKEDFSFQFDYGNGSVIGSSVPDVRTEIYAEKYQISYLDKEANRKSGYFLIYIWG